MPFIYDKKNAQCMWCKRTQNPHPDFSHETIPSKIFISKKGRRIELCFSCYENEIKSISKDIDFKEKLDKKFELLKVLNL
tara:strand:- start:1328 stop:1567 length:240 start_codon:yes stop_codon:yes gene_type:complete